MKEIQEEYIYKCNLELLEKKDNKFNFRCIFCGDSKKKKTKKRGWLLWNANYNTYIYYCFNCGVNTNFDIFLKNYDKELYREYKLNSFKSIKNQKVYKKIKKEKKEINFYKLDFLKEKLQFAIMNEKSRDFLLKRKIPERFYSKLFYIKNFQKFINTFYEKKFKVEIDDEYILIPYLDKKQNILFLEARNLNNKTPRYLHYNIFCSIFGLDELDRNKDIYVTEGVFDSMFIENCIAVGGVSKMLKINEKLKLPVEKFILIPDNEYKKPEINKQIIKFIKKGFRIAFFKDKNVKDINELALKKKINIKEDFEILQNRDAYLYLKLKELV